MIHRLGPPSTSPVHEQLVVMAMLEGPTAVGVALRFYDADRLGRPLVRRDARVPQVRQWQEYPDTFSYISTAVRQREERE